MAEKYASRLLSTFEIHVLVLIPLPLQLLMLFFFKAGKFTYVSDTNTLRNDMATYYDFFSSKTIRNEPIISIPYVDAFGTGKKRYACT